MTSLAKVEAKVDVNEISVNLLRESQSQKWGHQQDVNKDLYEKSDEMVKALNKAVIKILKKFEEVNENIHNIDKRVVKLSAIISIITSIVVSLFILIVGKVI